MGTRSMPFTVLVVDDDTDDCLIAMRAWEESGNKADLRFVHNGRTLMDYLHHRGQFNAPDSSPRPALILLDLKMPKKNGRQVLEEIKEDHNLNQIPIVIFTGSDRPKDMVRADTWGAYAFVTKPDTFGGYLQVMKGLSDSLLPAKPVLAG